MALRRLFSGWRIGTLLGLAVALALVPALRSKLAQGFEQKTIDARMRFRGTAEAAPEVVVCAIDATSVDRLGQWPWPREVMGDLIRRLHEAGARAIALDIVFSEPSRGGPGQDEALAAAIREAGNVVLGYYMTNETLEGGEVSPAPEPDQGPASGAAAGKGAAEAAAGTGTAGAAAMKSAAGGAATEMLLPSPVELALTPPGGFPEVPVYSRAETNIPLLTRAQPLAGQFLSIPDTDGTVRHYPMIVLLDGQFYPSLALRAVQVFLGTPPIQVRPYQGRLPLVSLGELEVPTSEKGELWVNFRGPYGRTFAYYPIADVLSGRVRDSAFAGRLVFIGATETGIGDTKTSPFDITVPGIEVHATVADNLLHRRFIRDGAPEAMLGIAALLLLGALCGTTPGLTRRPVLGAAAATGLLLVYALVAQVVFTTFSRHLYLLLPELGGVLAFTVSAVRQTVFVEAKARQIRGTFQRFVSPAIVEEMLRHPEEVRLSGEKRELTILFSDIRGFTSISETLPPDKIVTLLNEYLSPMTDIVLETGGTLDKYMGDAIMAFWGAPVAQDDHARRALGAALAMQARLVEMNREWPERGFPRLASGVGVNTGEVSVGNMGSNKLFDYTVIGDHVNLGSRLEGLTKMYGVRIIVSEYTVAKVPLGFVFRELDRVRVKGKKEPVRIYELMGAEGDAGMPRDFIQSFEYAVEMYRAGRFDQAESLFRDGLRQRPEDHTCALYLERLAALGAAPAPDGWDGVTNMTEK